MKSGPDLSHQKVLVSGAGGFIGSHLCEDLVLLGADVRAMVRYNSSNSHGLLEELPNHIYQEIEVFHGDVRDPSSTNRAVSGCNIVFHLAALIGIPYSYEAPRSYVDTNVVGTLNVLQACLERSVERVVHTSTSEVYGTARYTPIDEQHPLQGQSPYSASKIAADKLAESYYSSFDLPVVTMRPFNCFGPRQSARAFIPTVIAQLLREEKIHCGSLTPLRDYTFVKDTTAGFIACGTTSEIEGATINVGAGRKIAMGDLVNKIMKRMNVFKEVVVDSQRIRPEKSEVGELMADASLAAKLLHWAAKYTLDQGLDESIAYVQTHIQSYKTGTYVVQQMAWKVPLSDISFGPEEHQAVQRVLESGWISMGPETEQFEQEFAQYLGAKHAVAVSSGTAALHLALLALGIGQHDEVIVPSLTFVAAANAILYVGATPVFADITSLDDWNIRTTEIERRITPRTKAVIVLHYGGFPCQMDRINSIAQAHGLRVVEDAAHAPGASFRSKKLGTWADAGCFSFFSNKNLTSGEGGMVATNDHEIAARVRVLRSHGMTSLTWDRHQGHSFSYDVIATGYNYRMDEIRAALARVQLSKLEENNRKRRAITLRMREAFANLDSLALPFYGHDLNESAAHIFPILLKSADLRATFMAHMKDSGIQTSIHYPPIHKFSAYKHNEHNDLTLTEDVCSRQVTLPLFPAMSQERLVAIITAVRSSL